MADSVTERFGSEVIVADCGPLIGLTKLALLDLLPRCFSVVHIPQTVLLEATGHRRHLDTEALLKFIAVHEGKSVQIAPDVVSPFTIELGKLLDPGETQAINLAHSLSCSVFWDEKRGRLLAVKHGVPVFGLLGLLLRAKQANYLETVAPCLPILKSAGYRLSDRLAAQVLRLAGEDAGL